MKKIIAAIDGLKYSESTTEYAAQLTVEQNITRTMDEHDKMVQDNAASQFTETCQSAPIISVSITARAQLCRNRYMKVCMRT